ncbi:AraC family transcriptional regulator [Steroidobacter sp.]|uniref:AraC family transcriptional regulator n=1 Tax=Steroidobacter sp. TaxID=1978227 RepID=UPI001A5F28E4|nr:AraC family transcriptional regulator [Steroidobacter sp.]MBL8267088.1 AraC family transcriptional regulator ligand-binding domain-containing protein [Steroidobacter sp.]
MESSPGIVDVNALRGFPELVWELGGDSAALLRLAGIEPDLLDKRGASIEFRSLLRLMQVAAEELSCPDFGLRFANRQGGNKAIGPIGVVMKNSKTLGQAIGYCAKNLHAYSTATRVRFQPDRTKHVLTVRLQILLDNVEDKRQAVEHALLLASHNILEITAGTARVRKILLSHPPHSKQVNYRAYFGCEVLFEQEVDGLMLTEGDLLQQVVDPDERVYEMATAFIDERYPKEEGSIQGRVRRLILLHLGSGECTNERIAAELCMHPRTLQRRLRAEGTSFDDIRDELRREVAYQYIQNCDLPLKQLAEKLGYADASILSRSCYRWFSVSPQQLRTRLRCQELATVDAAVGT